MNSNSYWSTPIENSLNTYRETAGCQMDRHIDTWIDRQIDRSMKQVDTHLYISIQ